MVFFFSRSKKNRGFSHPHLVDVSDVSDAQHPRGYKSQNHPVAPPDVIPVEEFLIPLGVVF